MKKAIVVSVLGLSLTACSISPTSTEEAEGDVPASSETQEESQSQDESQTSGKDEKEQNKQSKPSQNEDVVLEGGTVKVGDPDSITVVVNKQRKLPSDYIPEDLTVPDVPFYFTEDHPKKQMREEAARALEKLFAAAEKDGLDLVAASGYRSYDRQKRIFERNVEIYGEEETKTFSAQPGTSEHQTGLAMDVTSAEMAFKLDQSFGNTDEGEWLAENAHEYGFVIRYREGAQDITGYTYEPWHLRYVGKEYSTEVHNQEVTLEEFFGLHPTTENK